MDELAVGVFFPQLTVHSGGVERTLKVIEHSASAGLRFTVFVSPDVIRDREVERRLKALEAEGRVTLTPQAPGSAASSPKGFDATLLPSEFWMPALRRSVSAGMRAPVFIQFHQLPYVGTLDVLKAVGVEEATPLDLARFPFVASKILGDGIPFFAFQTGACYLNVRALSRRREVRVMAVTPVPEKNLRAFGYRGDLFVPPVGLGMDPDPFPEVRSEDEPPLYDAVYVGRFHPHKGFLDLPRIAARLRETLSEDATIAVCGSPQFPRHQQLFDERVAAYGVEKNLRVLRWLSREDLYATIRRSRMLLYPSYVDGFSITVLESLCLGVPVAAYGIDALRLIWSSRKGVFLAPVGRPEALARLCADLVLEGRAEEARRAMPAQARALLETYAWEQVVRWERRFIEGEPSPEGPPPRPVGG